jgi:uncharacterized membrane protein YagU involved in acid resistance
MIDSCKTSQRIWPNVLAGAIGGLVASLAMNRFQAGISAVSQSMARKERLRKQPREQPEKNSQSSDEDATVKAAKAISTTLFHHELTEGEKKWAGPAVHYGLGTALGAVYGTLTPCMPVDKGAGASYGSAVWLGADEIAVPLFGLSGPPTETPLSGHMKALASHLVFGCVTHFTRRIILS